MPVDKPTLFFCKDRLLRLFIKIPDSDDQFKISIFHNKHKILSATFYTENGVLRAFKNSSFVLKKFGT